MLTLRADVSPSHPHLRRPMIDHALDLGGDQPTARARWRRGYERWRVERSVLHERRPTDGRRPPMPDDLDQRINWRGWSPRGSEVFVRSIQCEMRPRFAAMANVHDIGAFGSDR